MHILILGSTRTEPAQADREYYEEYLSFFNAAADEAHLQPTIDTCLLDDLIISVGEGQFRIYDTFNQRELHHYDLIFFRGIFRERKDILNVLIWYAKRHDIKVINEYAETPDLSKLTQAAKFELAGMPVGRTLMLTKGLLDHFHQVEDWEFPCIMKATYGAHGNDNHLVKSIDEIHSILKNNQTDARFVLQRFIPNDGDFRILIIGNRTLIISRKSLEGSHLNNTSQGGKATMVPLDSFPAEIITQSRQMCRNGGLVIAGVDVIQEKDTGQYYFLEINSLPQLMTGAFVDEKRALVAQLLTDISAQ